MLSYLSIFMKPPFFMLQADSDSSVVEQFAVHSVAGPHSLKRTCYIDDFQEMIQAAALREHETKDGVDSQHEEDEEQVLDDEVSTSPDINLASARSIKKSERIYNIEVYNTKKKSIDPSKDMW